MGAKNPDNEFPRGNSFSNLSQAINSTSREYVFAPVSYRVKLIIFTAMLFFGVYGLIANSLILYLKHKQYRRRCRSRQRPISRSLTEYLINSLALSDMLCCLISLPLFAAEMFIDFLKSDWICRFNRYFVVLFPMVTIFNLLIIGIERYVVIFYPYFVLRRRKVKRLVVVAWVFGSLVSLVFLPAIRRVNFEDISDNYHTLVCKYDSSLPLNRVLFTIINFISYFLPSLTLTFINIRILRRQRSSQRIHDTSRNTRQRALARLKVTRMFVSLIFAFIIPYMTFFLYSGLKTAVKFKVSFTDDYIVRHISGLLVYANGSVSATILIYYEKLYLDVLSCFQSRVTTNNQTVRREEAVNGENNKNERCTPV